MVGELLKCRFFLVKLHNQYLPRYIILFTKILKGAGTASGTVLQNQVFKNLWLKLEI